MKENNQTRYLALRQREKQRKQDLDKLVGFLEGGLIIHGNEVKLTIIKKDLILWSMDMLKIDESKFRRFIQKNKNKDKEQQFQEWSQKLSSYETWKENEEEGLRLLMILLCENSRLKSTRKNLKVFLENYKKETFKNRWMPEMVKILKVEDKNDTYKKQLEDNWLGGYMEKEGNIRITKRKKKVKIKFTLNVKEDDEVFIDNLYKELQSNMISNRFEKTSFGFFNKDSEKMTEDSKNFFDNNAYPIDKSVKRKGKKGYIFEIEENLNISRDFNEAFFIEVIKLNSKFQNQPSNLKIKGQADYKKGYWKTRKSNSSSSKNVRKNLVQKYTENSLIFILYKYLEDQPLFEIKDQGQFGQVCLDKRFSKGIGKIFKVEEAYIKRKETLGMNSQLPNKKVDMAGGSFQIKNKFIISDLRPLYFNKKKISKGKPFFEKTEVKNHQGVSPQIMKKSVFEITEEKLFEKWFILPFQNESSGFEDKGAQVFIGGPSKKYNLLTTKSYQKGVKFKKPFQPFTGSLINGESFSNEISKEKDYILGEQLNERSIYGFFQDITNKQSNLEKNLKQEEELWKKEVEQHFPQGMSMEMLEGRDVLFIEKLFERSKIQFEKEVF